MFFDLLLLIGSIALFRSTHNPLLCAGVYAVADFIVNFVARGNIPYSLIASAVAFVVSYVIFLAIDTVFK